MNHSPRRFLTAVCTSTVLAVACSGGEKAASQAQAPAAKPAAAAPASTAQAAGDFGVPECDQYVKKYLACLDGKVPEAARGMLRQSFEQSQQAWKNAAATPQGRAGLASACTQAEAAAKQSMQAYGCQW